VDAAWQKIESPQLKNITVDFSTIGATDLIMPSGANLFIGRPVEIYGRYTLGGKAVVKVQGERSGQAVTITKEIPFSTGANMNFMVSQVWARQTIELLSANEGATTKNKDAIIEVSVAYQVLSKYTAFLAINPQPIPPGDGSDEKVQNAFGTEIHDPHVFNSLKGMLNALVMKIFKGVLKLILPENAYLTGLRVFDLQGRCVFDFTSSATARIQTFEWDGMISGGSRLIPGRYVARIQTTTGIVTRSFSWK
jgi:hypothetical protein